VEVSEIIRTRFIEVLKRADEITQIKIYHSGGQMTDEEKQ